MAIVNIGKGLDLDTKTEELILDDGTRFKGKIKYLEGEAKKGMEEYLKILNK